MKTFTIEVRGKTKDDIMDAITEVVRKMSWDFLEGFDSNEDGDFDYTSEGDYEEVKEEQ